ncbi:699_t:CDS:2, partial [Gigaspora margarita]
MEKQFIYEKVIIRKVREQWNICIDKDLEINKTLSAISFVNKIYANLKHLSKNIRKSIRCVYATGLHKENKDKVCWYKDNSKLDLAQPNLKEFTIRELEKFRIYLKLTFHLPAGQSLVTMLQTSHNEARNRVKLMFNNKILDYWKSYKARHVLAIIYNNDNFISIQDIRYEDEIVQNNGLREKQKRIWKVVFYYLLPPLCNNYDNCDLQVKDKVIAYNFKECALFMLDIIEEIIKSSQDYEIN